MWLARVHAVLEKFRPYLRGLMVCLLAGIITIDFSGFLLFASVACDRPLRKFLLAFGFLWLIYLGCLVAVWISDPPASTATKAMGLAGMALFVLTAVGHFNIWVSETCAKTSSAKGAPKFSPGVSWFMGASLFDVALQNCVLFEIIMVFGIIYLIAMCCITKRLTEGETKGAFGSGGSSV